MSFKHTISPVIIISILLSAQLTFGRDAKDYTDDELSAAGWSEQQILKLRGKNNDTNLENESSGSIHIDHYCGYFDSNNPGSIHPFRAESRVESLIDEVMAITGLPRNFEVIAGGVPNAAALMVGEKRVIAYNQTFLYDVEQAIQNKWPAYSIMAHEIGHHLAGHALTKVGSRPATELEADKYSGFVMQRLGATLKEAQMVMQLIGTDNGSLTHPPRRDRLAAIASGWLEECDRDANCGTNSEKKPSSSREPTSTQSREIKTIANEANATIPIQRGKNASSIVSVSTVNGMTTLQTNSNNGLALVGSKKVSTRSYSVSSITAVNSSSGIKWRYDPTIGPIVLVSADENFHDAVYPKVDSGKLSINVDAKLLITENEIEVTWGGPAPKKLNISGSASFELMDIETSSLELTVSGSSNVFATGNVGNLKLRLSGSSVFEGVYFQSRYADVSVSGSSQAGLAVSESTEGKVTGSSNVTLYGDSDTTGFSKASSATVRVVRR